MKRMILGLFLMAGVVGGCSGSSNNTPGTGGSGAGSTGTAGSAAAGTSGGGAGGASTGGTGGGTAGFMAIMPCPTEASYVSGTTINFGGSAGFAYAPNCLEVPAGTMVTFAGDFSLHPLSPSAARGNTTDNPIVDMSAGTTASVTFSAPGFYAYFCAFHGSSDTGAGMAGVVWVQ